MNPEQDDRSIADVLQAILGNIQDIVRSEVRLAKTEIREGFEKVRPAAVLIVAGSIAGLFSILFLLLAAMYAMATVMPNWAAALVIVAVLAVGCALSLGAGIRTIRNITFAPATTASLKETMRWSKRQVR